MIAKITMKIVNLKLKAVIQVLNYKNRTRMVIEIELLREMIQLKFFLIDLGKNNL